MTTPSTPTWITPADPGGITNGAGTGGTSGTGAGNSFTPPLTVQYRSPGGVNDGPAAARYKLTQSRMRGVSISPTTAYDSGWGRPAVGPTGAVTDLPAPSKTASRGALWAESVGRVYVIDISQNLVWSAPVSGLSVGTWRMENPPPKSMSMQSEPVLINGQIYVVTTSGIVQAPLNSDGTLGTWVYSGPSTGGGAGWAGAPTPAIFNLGTFMCGLDFGAGQGGLLVIFNGGTTQVPVYTVSGTTGTVSGWLGTSSLPGFSNWGGACIDTSWWPGGLFPGNVGWVHVISGSGTNTYWASITLPGSATVGTLGSWSSGVALPSGLFRFAMTSTPQLLSGGRLNGPDYGKDLDMFVMGGQAGTNLAVTNQVLAISGVSFRGGGSWTTITPASGFTPTIYGGACTWPMPGANPGLPAMVVGQFGGYSDPTGGAANLQVQTFFPGQMSSAPNVPTPYSQITNLTTNPGALLPEAVVQPDGSYYYTFTPHAPNATSWGGPFDGDEYTIEVDFVSQQTGDPSPAGLTTVSFAKAPSIEQVTPTGTITNGNPTISFAYQPGAYGGTLLNWQALVTLGGTTIADSGVQTGDTVWTPGPAPYLAPGQTYGLEIIVTSVDTPMTSGDSNTATYQGTFTVSYVVPDPPFNLSCVQDLTRGAVTATWTNPTGTAFNRLYYRISGSTAWWLLQDSIAASTSMTLTVIDQLALGQTYDFAVTAVDNTQSLESGIVVSLSNGDVENPGPSGPIPSAAPVYNEGFEETTTNTVLWRSLGTDCLNSLDGWTLINGGYGGSTIYANTLRQGYSGWAQAGHPDWQDGTLSVRFTIPLGGVPAWPKAMIHVGPGGTSWVSMEWVPVSASTGILRLWTQSPQFTGVIAQGVTLTQTAGSSYWFTLQASGQNYIGRLYSDSAGAVGTLLGTVSGIATSTAIGSGQVALTFLGENGFGSQATRSNPMSYGSIDWGGAFANVCTWSGTVPTGWSPTVPSGTASTLSTAFTDTLANLTNWNQMTTTSATVASNVVTLPVGSGILSKAQYSDGVWTMRMEQGATAADCPWIYVRASGGSQSTSVPWAMNSINFQFNPYNTNASPIAIWKTLNGSLTEVGVSSGNVTIAATTFYWWRCIMQGPNITVQLYSDSAGAIGTLMAEANAHVPDAVLQQGSIGIAEGYGPGAFGGNFSNVCLLQTSSKASGPGEPAFALSGWESQAGQHSVSIYQPTGQTLTSNSSWEHSSETTLVPVTQGDSYQFSTQFASSNAANGALVVEEYNSGGSLLQTTVLNTLGTSGSWQLSVTVTAAGSSGNYTNSTRSTSIRSSPSFSASVVGTLLEGQPAITLGYPVNDAQLGGAKTWWPIQWNGATAYLWTADAPGPYTTTRAGLQPTSYALIGQIVPQATTAFLGVRPTVTGPGLHYYDQILINSVPNTAPAWFTSFGTDAIGTLASWTLTNTPTIASHVVTIPANASLVAGHADWANISMRLRFQATSSFSDLWVLLGARGSNTYALITTTGTGAANGEVTISAGGTVAGGQNFAVTSGSFYWLFWTVNGSTVSYYVVADSGGAPGTTVLAQASVTGASITPGPITLYCDTSSTSSAVVGGAFPQVCTVYPVYMPANWTMVNPAGWTSLEPAFCWDNTKAESGVFSLGISSKVAPSGGNFPYWVTTLPAETTALSVSPSISYTITAWYQGTATSNLYIEQWNAAGASTNVNTSNLSAQGAWTLRTVTLTTAGTTAFMSVRYALTAAGSVWCDNVAATPVAGSDNIVTSLTVTGPNARGIFHLAGNNGADVVALYMGTYMRSQVGGPQVTYNFDTTQIPLFGVGQPVVRAGAMKWRSIQLNVIFLSPSDNSAWTALRDLSYDTGTPIIYRDTSGRQMVCVQANGNHQSQHEPSNYLAATYLQNQLWETVNKVSPFTSAAYVQGLRALVNGTLPPLAETEAI